MHAHSHLHNITLILHENWKDLDMMHWVIIDWAVKKLLHKYVFFFSFEYLCLVAEGHNDYATIITMRLPMSTLMKWSVNSKISNARMADRNEWSLLTHDNAAWRWSWCVLVFWTIDAQIGTFTSFSLSLNFVRKILYSVMVLLDKAHRFFLLFLYRILIA